MAIVRFEDVATRVNTKEDRLNTSLIYYVGGEHIESNEMKVSGRGIIKNADLGPMFYFGFKPGDILFVTRNPHLRKSAMVDFSGICSEKTLVIATKDENILSQRYLASIMQSDDFWEFMEENKSGSVNYFINWSTLADYEFDLPPIERQRELADLLWAANDLKEAYKKLIAVSDEMLQAKFKEMFEPSEKEGSCKEVKKAKVKLAECGEIFTGSTPTTKREDFWENEDIPFYKPSDFNDGLVLLTKSEYYVDRRAESVCRMFESGDILVTCIATIGKVGIAMERGTCNQQINFIKPNQKCKSKYLAYALAMIGPKLALAAKSSVLPIINKTEFSQIQIPLPPLSLQEEFVEIANQQEKVKQNLRESIVQVENIIKGLINS